MHSALTIGCNISLASFAGQSSDRCQDADYIFRPLYASGAFLESMRKYDNVSMLAKDFSYVRADIVSAQLHEQV